MKPLYLRRVNRNHEDEKNQTERREVQFPAMGREYEDWRWQDNRKEANNINR